MAHPEALPGLAGKLSHSYQTDSTHFIGPLSRLERAPEKPTIDFLVLLSGPEPQRTIPVAMAVRGTERQPMQTRKGIILFVPIMWTL